MKLKQNGKKGNNILLIVVFIILGIFALSLLHNFFFNKNAIAFSCNEEKISGYTITTMPPSCVACTPTCKVEMEAFYNGNKICEGTGTDFGTGNLGIECDELDKFIGKEILVKYNITKNDEIVSNEEKIKVEWE